MVRPITDDDGQPIATGDEADLMAMIADWRPKVIGVDGVNGQGKSTLARALGRPVVHVDGYLDGLGRFVEGIDYDRLRDTLASMPGPFVFDGCCGREIAERVGLVVNLWLYVIRRPTGLRWENRELVEGAEADHLLDQHNQIADARKGNRDGLERDLIIYHAQHRPAHHADFALVTTGQTDRRSFRIQ